MCIKASHATFLQLFVILRRTEEFGNYLSIEPVAPSRLKKGVEVKTKFRFFCHPGMLSAFLLFVQVGCDWLAAVTFNLGCFKGQPSLRLEGRMAPGCWHTEQVPPGKTDFASPPAERIRISSSQGWALHIVSTFFSPHTLPYYAAPLSPPTVFGPGAGGPHTSHRWPDTPGSTTTWNRQVRIKNLSASPFNLIGSCTAHIGTTPVSLFSTSRVNLTMALTSFQVTEKWKKCVSAPCELSSLF